MSKKCPCCSGLLYEECCQPYHEGRLVENALKLMRSRFAAYALNLPKYIICTTHADNPEYSNDSVLWQKQVEEFSRRTIFQNLEILSFDENGSQACVAFVAYLLQGNQDITFTEKSFFLKVEDRWLYQSGIVKQGH